MSIEVLKSVRIDDRRKNTNGCKLDVIRDGRKKYTIWWDNPELGLSIKKQVSDPNQSDDWYITQALIDNQKGTTNDGGKTWISGNKYVVIQDPYSDTPPTKRIYGNTPYYLNDGSYVLIKWFGKESDKDEISSKYVEIYPPISSGIKDYYTQVNGGYGIQYASKTKLSGSDIEKTYIQTVFNMLDKDVMTNVLTQLKIALERTLSTTDSELKICEIDDGSWSTTPNQTIPFNDYLTKSEIKSIEGQQNIGSLTQSVTMDITTPIITNAEQTPKIKLSLVGLPDTITIKAKTNLTDFTVFTGSPTSPTTNSPTQDAADIDTFENLPELDGISDEYTEGSFGGSEETIYEAPYSTLLDTTSDMAPTNLDSAVSSGLVSEFNGPAGSIKLELWRNKKAAIGSVYMRNRNTSERHLGNDYFISSGTELIAPLDAVVVRAGYELSGFNGYGGVVLLKCSVSISGNIENYYMLFGHMKQVNVRQGDSIRKGTSLGLSGGNPSDPHKGESYGAHLHFELIIKGKRVEPLFHVSIANTHITTASSGTLSKLQNGTVPYNPTKPAWQGGISLS